MQMSNLYVSDLPLKNFIYFVKKQIDISFLCVCSFIEDKFRHNIVKSLLRKPWLSCRSRFHSHFDNVMTQFIINKRTDA